VTHITFCNTIYADKSSSRQTSRDLLCMTNNVRIIGSYL